VGVPYAGPLVLDEVCPNNKSLLKDPADGKYHDYIELTSSADLDLSGLYLSRTPFHPAADWVFPAGSSITKDQHLVVWCDKNSAMTNPGQGLYCTNFNLNKSGEAIFIFGADASGQAYIDGLKYGAAGTDEAWSRVPDGDRAAAFVLETGSPGSANPGAAPKFIRGDADGTGVIDLTDAVFALEYLFMAGQAPGCLEAADADDSGVLDLTDPIYTLEYLFLAGPVPPAPFPSPGTDPTADSLGCEKGSG
jgi:hypothetical protein